MKTQITVTKNDKNYTVEEDGKAYSMPFILKYILEKYLVTEGNTKTTPVATWYNSLNYERKALIDVSEIA